MKHLLWWLLALPCLASDSPTINWSNWSHQGKMVVATDPQWAEFPPQAQVENFPLLVRLHRDWFNFNEAQTHGEDLRFTNEANELLAYQIEQWDPVRGEAAIWVRIPVIKGFSRQYLQLHWGNPQAPAASDGTAVFNPQNHFLSVWHLGSEVKDETGLLKSQDTGTQPTPGIIGIARHFSGKVGISGGDKITSFPTGSSPHSTELWFRPEKPNSRLVAWGNEKPQGKMVMQYASPSHIRTDCYFSDGNVESPPFPAGTWIHVVHTYQKGQACLYINGELAAQNVGRSSPLNLQSPLRFAIGGWYNQYDFTGDIDEVRVSNEARSAAWVKLCYENQKPLQSVHGLIMQTAHPADVSPRQAEMAEGTSQLFTVQPGNAEQIKWYLREDGETTKTLVATNVLHYQFSAGRVTQSKIRQLSVELLSARSSQIFTLPLKISKTIPDPVVKLKAPETWNGRDHITLTAEILNEAELKAKHGAELNTHWKVEPFAVTKNAKGTQLELLRAQNSGPLTITALVDNGGSVIQASTTLQVQEPAQDPWITRPPEADEKPEDHQFFACDDQHTGVLYYQGHLTQPAEKLVLTVWSEDQTFAQVTQKPDAQGHYLFQVKLQPGLTHYRTELIATQNGQSQKLHEAHDLVCGDAYILMGQSNAVSTDWGKEEPPAFTSEWIRTFGAMGNQPQSPHLWGPAVYRTHDAGKLQIGYWGMELARRLVAQHHIPICIINGAVGGTRIDQHQRNPQNPTDNTTLYGHLLQRVQDARLTDGIRGIFWHQGENDQGADGPTGGYGYEHYRELFLQLASDWKTDYPNVQHYMIFQIWPKSCAMGINGSDNQLREVQRNLPTAFSHLSMMSTLGIEPPGGCHFPPAGYTEFARLLFPIVERDFYGVVPSQPVTPPNLRRAVLNKNQNEITLTFDQPVAWSPELATQFYCDNQANLITEGAAQGPTLVLKLKNSLETKPLPRSRHLITYLDSKSWSQKTLLRGTNGLAAFTFCEVPLEETN